MNEAIIFAVLFAVIGFVCGLAVTWSAMITALPHKATQPTELEKPGLLEESYKAGYHAGYSKGKTRTKVHKQHA